MKVQRRNRGPQEKLGKPEEKDIEQFLEYSDPEKFWEDLGSTIRAGIGITLEKTISYEFRQFIGALRYERSPKRRDVQNGYRFRDFGTICGLIENI